MRFERAQRCYENAGKSPRPPRAFQTDRLLGAAQGGRASDVRQCESGFLWLGINLPLKAGAWKNTAPERA